MSLQDRIAADRSDMPIIFISGYGDVPKPEPWAVEGSAIYQELDSVNERLARQPTNREELVRLKERLT